MTRLIPPSSARGQALSSWSWFSKDGPIKYLPLKFTQVDWATGKDFLNPLESLVSRLRILRGLAREVLVPSSDLLVHIRFDQEGEFDVGDLLGVVIGRDKVVAEGGSENVKHHVLVIRQVPRIGSDKEEEGQYERVGVLRVQAHSKTSLDILQESGHWRYRNCLSDQNTPRTSQLPFAKGQSAFFSPPTTYLPTYLLTYLPT